MPPVHLRYPWARSKREGMADEEGASWRQGKDVNPQPMSSQRCHSRAASTGCCGSSTGLILQIPPLDSADGKCQFWRKVRV